MFRAFNTYATPADLFRESVDPEANKWKYEFVYSNVEALFIISIL